MLSLNNAINMLSITSLKPKQEKILELLSQSTDFFVTLPTGYGKSVAFQLAPFCLEDDEDHAVIVVMPLQSLMTQQAQYLQSCGFNVFYLGGAQSDLSSILTCTHVFCSPETLTKHVIPYVQKMPRSQQKRFSHVIIDETHCVAEWGLADSKTEAFRKEYSNISQIRSILPRAAVIALTATAPTSMVNLIKELLVMTENCPIVKASPEKKNIRYSVLPETSIDDVFLRLSNIIMNDPDSKYLIFCTQLKYVGKIYNIMRCILPANVVEMYHKKTPETKQRAIVQELTAQSGCLKAVVCSSSFSMGINIPKLNCVVHYGMPSTINGFMQETGRGGREGQRCSSVVIYHRDAAKGDYMSGESKEYLKLKTCRREYLLKQYGCQPSLDRAKFLCCDICTQQYACCNCNDFVTCNHVEQLCFCVKWCYSVFSFTMSPVEKPVNLCKRTKISLSDIALLHQDLLDLRTKEGILPENICDVYPELINTIIDNHEYIGSVNDVLEAGAYSFDIAEKLVVLLNKYSELL